MNKAFVLGAGLGERLRPLTDQLPKPLVPVFHRPLIGYAFDHLAADVGVRDFVVNTFHLAETYDTAFPEGSYRGMRVTTRKDAPVRLETAGGLANVRDLLDDGEPFIVYNGDVLTDMPLAPLLKSHQESGHLVTLALRSRGPALHIALDEATGHVRDIRNKLGTGHLGSHLFTGIYCVDPAFFDWLTPGQPESVIPIFLRLIAEGQRLGGVVIDEGHWWDLGSRAAYLEAHLAVAGLSTPFTKPGAQEPLLIHPAADISPLAKLDGLNIIGPGASVAPGAHLCDCIVWPNGHVAGDAQLERCIVRSGMTAQGVASGLDI